MKLKPLIKTHWVASQNPMAASLGGLERIVFAPPTDLLNFEFLEESGSGSSLAALEQLRTLAPSPSEPRDVNAKSQTQARDILWATNHYRQSSHSHLIAIAHSVEFYFADGDCLLLPGVFRKAGLPRFLDPLYYLQDSSCNWDRTRQNDDALAPLKLPARLKTEDLKRIWFTVLEILAWALQRKRQVGDLEVLWANSQRMGFPIEDIEFLKSAPLAATVTTAASRACIRVWQGTQLDASPNTIRFHSHSVLGELSDYLQSSADSQVPTGEELERLPRSCRWQSQFVSVESHPVNLVNALAKLERAIAPEHVFLLNHSLIENRNLKPSLRVRENEGSLELAVSFHLSDLELDLLNFPASLSVALQPFLGGIDHYLRLERKEAASQSPQYRTNDLLLLRHQGLAIFCLFELINWILKKPLSSGHEIPFAEDLESPEADYNFQRLIRYFEDSIPALLGKSPERFNDLFSRKGQTFFIEYVENLFQHLSRDRFFFFHNDRLIEIANVQEQVLPILRFLILHFIETSRGKFLTRTQAPLGERLTEAFRNWTDSSLLPSTLARQVRPLWVDIGLFNTYSISLLFELNDQGVAVEFNGTSLHEQDHSFEFSFSVNDAPLKEDSNWFDLHPQIFFNGTRVPPEEVKINFGQGQVGFIEYQGQLYRIDKKELPSLKSLQRFWKRITGQKELIERNSFGEKVYRLQKSQALELLMLKAQGFRVEVEGEWKRIFDYFESGLGVEKIQIADYLESVLLPHQREGVQWLHDLYQLKLGAILADEMGLGKTLQVLTFLMSLHAQKELKKCLIIVPTSLVYNWIEEKKKFAPELPMRAFVTHEKEDIRKALSQDDPMVLVATYGLLIENPQFFHETKWNILVFDEAQNLKNITSQRTVAARKLDAQFKVCVTGTPMENNYLEFFSLCDLVVPGSLGNIDTFRRQYWNREVRSESLYDLRLISKPLVLRRTKQQVQLRLPTKTVHNLSLPFGPEQKEIYKKMALTYSRQVDQLIQDQGEKKAQIAMFTALMRLRQICSDPTAVPGVIYHERPAKVEHFVDSLQDHLENGESVIVFTQFLSTLHRLERELKRLHVPAYTLQGNVSAKERVRLISAFQENTAPAVMLMTLKTGGVGLNLTKASVVYHMEPWWNPAVENQATDRAHRMGQTKEVAVYNLLIEGSLEERIADLKVKKQESFDRLFGVEEQIEESGAPESNALTRDDFMYLLK